jgi:hypothetical protein
MQSRIKSSCDSLVEIRAYYDNGVSLLFSQSTVSVKSDDDFIKADIRFLHQIVKDFVSQSQLLDGILLGESLNVNINANIRFARFFYAFSRIDDILNYLFRQSALPKKGKSGILISEIIPKFLQYIKATEIDIGKSQTSLVDEFNSNMTNLVLIDPDGLP